MRIGAGITAGTAIRYRAQLSFATVGKVAVAIGIARSACRGAGSSSAHIRAMAIRAGIAATATVGGRGNCRLATISAITIAIGVARTAVAHRARGAAAGSRSIGIGAGFGTTTAVRRVRRKRTLTTVADVAITVPESGIASSNAASASGTSGSPIGAATYGRATSTGVNAGVGVRFAAIGGILVAISEAGTARDAADARGTRGCTVRAVARRTTSAAIAHARICVRLATVGGVTIAISIAGRALDSANASGARRSASSYRTLCLAGIAIVDVCI